MGWYNIILQGIRATPHALQPAGALDMILFNDGSAYRYK